MAIWNVATVEEDPEITLVRWLVIELPNGDRHFVGHNAAYLEGRVSSKILEWDSQKRIGKTKSGRTYLLEGESSIDDDAAYVFQHWKQVNKVEEFRILKEEEL